MYWICKHPNPIYRNGTNYVPLRRASNASQYTLGRASFQEAYLLADFEHGNFPVSEPLFPANSAPNIVSIDYSQHSSVSVTDANLPPTIQTRHHLSAGAIAGIAIGTSTLLLILLCTIAFFPRGRHKPSSPPAEKESWPSSPDSKPRHLSDPETTTLDATSNVRELEDTQTPRSPGRDGSCPRQGLAGSATAKGLRPLPPEKVRHVSELAAD